MWKQFTNLNTGLNKDHQHREIQLALEIRPEDTTCVQKNRNCHSKFNGIFVQVYLQKNRIQTAIKGNKITGVETLGKNQCLKVK